MCNLTDDQSHPTQQSKYLQTYTQYPKPHKTLLNPQIPKYCSQHEITPSTTSTAQIAASERHTHAPKDEARNQVTLIKDTIKAQYLRTVITGSNSPYKSIATHTIKASAGDMLTYYTNKRYWEMSQNCDRFRDTISRSITSYIKSTAPGRRQILFMSPDSCLEALLHAGKCDVPSTMVGINSRVCAMTDVEGTARLGTTPPDFCRKALLHGGDLDVSSTMMGINSRRHSN